VLRPGFPATSKRRPGPGIATQRVTLTAEDGNQLLAYVSSPSHPNGAGVVVLPDVRGVYPFYESVAVDLANHGYHAVVIDYYGRTAGTGPRGEDFDPTAHDMRTTTDGVQTDIRAAAAHLRGHNAHRIATLGFCFGGRHAFLTSAPAFGFAGTIGVYGVPGTGGPLGPGPTQQADQLGAPILGVFGGADEYLPVAEGNAFGAALTEHGIDHELLYPGAPHSFFDIKHADHRQASMEAWEGHSCFPAPSDRRAISGRMMHLWWMHQGKPWVGPLARVPLPL
jgi:carboxymethylenebutenolidase